MSQETAPEVAPFSLGNAVQQAPEASSSAHRDVESSEHFPADTGDPSGSSLVRSKEAAGKRTEISAALADVASPPAEHASFPSVQADDYELHDLFYEKERRLRGPLGLLSSIFTCWSRTKERSGSFQSRPRLNSFTTAALLEQTRLQQEALLETQDTRDMWEWQMEQQQIITSQEHDLLERSSVENPLDALPDLVRNSSARRSTSLNILGELSRNANFRREQEGKEEPDLKSKDSPAGSESPSWDLCNQINNVWQDPELVSALMLLFESALLRCRSEVNFFCRVYMQQMVLSGYTLIRTLMEMEPNTVFLRKVHASYALESRINSVLFRCFENDSFDESGLTQIFDPTARALARLQDYLRMKCADPEEALRMHNPSYEPAFHTFCADKSEEIMSMFPWNMGYRSAAERDRFMEAFLRAAKWVWLLHRLANATNPPIQIIRVGRGQEVDPLYVEAVAVPPIGSCQNCPVTSIPKVEFMIMPGFIAHRKVFRCKTIKLRCRHALLNYFPLLRLP